MLEAVVSVALRAIAISVVLGAVLAALVFFATRALALTAATRHALWTTAMVAMAAMPLAGVGMSVSRALLHDAAAQRIVPAATQTRAVRALPDAPSSSASASAGAAGPVSAAPSLGERFSSAMSTPRLTRQIAGGLVVLWAAGAAIGLAGLAMSVLRVRGLRRRSSPLDGELANELPWLTEVGPGREIYLRLSYETETPVAIGFRRPVILIPTELATADGLAAIESLILHEHAHLRRYDDWTNLVQRTIERIFWFNPLVWIVGRRIALEREIASDDAVVEKTGAAKEYATSLWRLAREMRMPEHAVVAPGALLTRKQISVRIEQLLDANRARLHRSPGASLGVAAAALFAVVLVATSAPAIELPAAAGPLVAVAPPITAIAQVGASLRPHTHAVPHAQPSPAAEQHVRTIIVVADAASPRPLAPRLPPLPIAPVDADVARMHEQLAAMKAQSELAKQQLKEHLRARAELGTSIGTSVGTTVGATVAEAMREAFSTGSPSTNGHLHGSFDGIAVSRSMVASCLGCSFRNADLHGVDLSGLSIVGSDFRGANLRGANLSGSKLSGDSLVDADVSGANLVGARLSGVDVGGASFDHANLHGAHLTGIDLSHANLTAADLTDARMEGCDLSGADLHGARTTGLVLTGSGLDG